MPIYCTGSFFEVCLRWEINICFVPTENLVQFQNQSTSLRSSHLVLELEKNDYCYLKPEILNPTMLVQFSNGARWFHNGTAKLSGSGTGQSSGLGQCIQHVHGYTCIHIYTYCITLVYHVMKCFKSPF